MGATTFAVVFVTVSQTLSLPSGLLSAVCYVESRHKPAAVNVNDGGSKSLGICQIKLTTARVRGYRGSEEKLRMPGTNIYYAGKILKSQLVRYKGDVKKAVAAYNAGIYRENECGETMNRKYVKKVMRAWKEGR